MNHQETHKFQILVDELRKFLPQKNIYIDELRRLTWGTDASFYRLLPRVVVRTDNEEQVSNVVAACSRLKLPFTFRAAGTSLSGQSVSDSVLIVAGKRWEKMTIEEGGNIVRLQPGVVGAEVGRRLKHLGRVFPPDPASIGSAMVGGIVSNNASGMNCGIHANSDKMLQSVRMVLADGTVVDTGDAESRESFQKSHAKMLQRIVALRDRVRADEALVAHIQHKYAIKNVTGLNLRPLVAYDDVFDIMAHSLVGAEGTLAFISEVRMRTLRDYPFRASAMVYFMSMRESCEAVVALKKLMADADDLQWSAEQWMVKSAEMLDYKSLESVADPVYLRYCKDVDEGKIAGIQKGNYRGLTALLIETKAPTHDALDQRIVEIEKCLDTFQLYAPATFTEDPNVYGRYWAIRSGIFPSVGGTRPEGTTCLIEDVAFHLEDLPVATVKLQQLLADHGYNDACIYGHAFEGNYHFIINQDFSTEQEVHRYERLMRAVAQLVVEEYDGSLKAEHGTGRNMAPFVRYEWGDAAFDVMRELKNIFDPENLLNPGVIFNDDAACFIKHLKPLPVLSYPLEHLPDSPTVAAAIEGVRRANKCIECGFCEVNCVSCGFTISSRMRIAAQREILYLKNSGTDDTRLHRLEKQYQYFGNQTCAADGRCATSCPMKINTGDVTHLVRQMEMHKRPLTRAVGQHVAKHFTAVKHGLRNVLTLADTAHAILRTPAMQSVAFALHRAGLPLWTPAMPHRRRQPSPLLQLPEHVDKVVYFPSCINQTMGLSSNTSASRPLVEETCDLLHKAGFQPIFPEGMERMCCGQIWESKGMMEVADEKSHELEIALWKASEEGRWPILCDQSPCLHRMRKVMKGLKLYEPAEFIMTFLKDRLVFHPTDRPVTIHLTCSTREMGLSEQMTALAHLCAHHVFVPDGVGCCAFAGDKGFTHPELNSYALRKLRPQIEAQGVEQGFSNSRTCEIGLESHAGIPYMSIVYLVNACTEAKRIATD